VKPYPHLILPKKVKNHAVINEELSAAENMRKMKILKKYN